MRVGDSILATCPRIQEPVRQGKGRGIGQGAKQKVTLRTSLPLMRVTVVLPEQVKAMSRPLRNWTPSNWEPNLSSVSCSPACNETAREVES